MGLKRWLVLFAATLFQLCLGGVYAWSYFIPHLEAEFSINAVQAQPIFGICIFVFTLCMIAGGRLQHRYGPRRVALAGAFFYAGGYFGAAVSADNFLLLLLFKGVVEGIGIGLGYVCPLTTALHWFPRRKGMVTGCVVGGFGSGAVVLSYAARYLQSLDLSLGQVFSIIGLGYLLVAGAAAAMLSLPPADVGGDDDEPAGDRDHFPSLGEILGNRSFLMMTAGMFAGTFGGLLVIGSLNPIAITAGLAPGQAVLTISIFSIGNSLGRLFWGGVIDRCGTITIPVSLFLLSGFVFLLLPDWTLPPVVFIITAGLTGFSFAACFVLYAAQTAFFFKPTLVGTIYPIMFFLGYGVSGILGPGTGALLQQVSGGHTMPIVTGATVVFAGAVFTLFYRSALNPAASAANNLR